MLARRPAAASPRTASSTPRLRGGRAVSAPSVGRPDRPRGRVGVTHEASWKQKSKPSPVKLSRVLIVACTVRLIEAARRGTLDDSRLVCHRLALQAKTAETRFSTRTPRPHRARGREDLYGSRRWRACGETYSRRRSPAILDHDARRIPTGATTASAHRTPRTPKIPFSPPSSRRIGLFGP